MSISSKNAPASVVTAWTPVSYANSWVDFDVNHPVQYRKEGDRVWLRGLMKLGTVGLASFTLPAGFRPAQEETFAVVANGALGAVTVNLSGTVVTQSGTSNVYVYLAGISFSVSA
jgi:hypothetical protein